MSSPVVYASTTTDSFYELINGCVGNVLSLHAPLTNARGAQQAASAGFSYHDDACAVSKGSVRRLGYCLTLYGNMIQVLHRPSTLGEHVSQRQCQRPNLDVHIGQQHLTIWSLLPSMV